MAKVHPNGVSEAPTAPPPAGGCAAAGRPAEVLTVWRKSLLFNCSGFTVFDCKGNLVFRVDNYAAGNRDEVVLMDAAGKPLLTIRRKVYITYIYISALQRLRFFLLIIIRH